MSAIVIIWILIGVLSLVFHLRGAEMTDRRLLELAIKAAEIKPPPRMQGWFYSAVGPYGEGMYAGSDRTDHVIWNPLKNDGDALRLAAKRSMHISITHWVGCLIDDYLFVSVDDCGGDIFAAVRRAIVLTAAEQGKEMP